MRVLRLVLAGVLAVALPIAANADQPTANIGPANARPAPGIVMTADGGVSGGRSGAIGGRPTAGHVRQWNGGRALPHRGPGYYSQGWGPYGRQGVPTYWVWGPSGGAFDYPFADWRGPTGGWGNP